MCRTDTQPDRHTPLDAGASRAAPGRDADAGRPADVPPGIGDAPVRLDVWLDVACLFKTRSAAQQAVKGGKVDVNGARGRPNREVRPGDAIVITRPMGRKQHVVVRATATQHLPRADARAFLYEDVTPPPTPEELAFQQLLRDTRPRGPVASPDKRQRRELRRLKGRE